MAIRRKHPPQVGTIGGLIVQQLRLTIHCDVGECQTLDLDLEALKRELGPDYRIADLVARSRCSKCGAKWPQLSMRVGPIHKAKIEKLREDWGE